MRSTGALVIGIGVLAMGVLTGNSLQAQTTGSVHGGGTRTSPFATGAGQATATQPPAAQGGEVVIITGDDPAMVAQQLQDMGYKAKLETNSSGNPSIGSSMSGVNYSLDFYGCTNGRACLSMQFSAGFNLDNGMTGDQVVEWQRMNRYAYVYLNDENDPFLSMDVNLYGGGITLATFQDYVALWETLLGGFKTHINW